MHPSNSNAEMKLDTLEATDDLYTFSFYEDILTFDHIKLVQGSKQWSMQSSGKRVHINST